MSVEIKRVSYSYNSALEDLGHPSYFLDVLISKDKQTIVDRHESFKSKDELYEAMDMILPILESV